MTHPEGAYLDAACDDLVAARVSRRAILRTGAGATGMGLLSLVRGTTTPGVAQSAQIGDVLVFPRHGSLTASPGTEITFRGISADDLGAVTVVGDETGGHSGVLLAHADGLGASYLPDAPFAPGEDVTVEAGVLLNSSTDRTVVFTVSRPGEPLEIPANRETDNPETPTLSFRSRPDLRPPVITVTDSEEGASPEYVFAGAKTQDAQNGPMIVDNQGELVWFSPLAVDISSLNDVRVQTYQGQPVITWWEGVSAQGQGLGHFVMMDSSYQEIARVQVGNGYAGADLHEFLLTPQGTALIVVYNRLRWDLSEAGGSRYGTALDSIVQELEIGTGRVLFEWHSLDHIGIDEGATPPPSNASDAYDYVHINAIELDDDVNLIVTARNTFGVYKIDQVTSEIVWRLNGSHSDFTMGLGSETAFHHDARVQANGNITLFDNHESDEDSGEESRGVELALDTESMTATLIREYAHPTGILSVSQGNMQVLSNGNVFIGWGSAPVFSEFSPDGMLLFNGRFPTTVNSYRAYRFPWVGTPLDNPAIAIERRGPTTVTLFASWNGASEIANWTFFAGPTADQLQPVGSAPRSGFETRLTLQSTDQFFAAQAEDEAGSILGVSPATLLSPIFRGTA